MNLKQPHLFGLPPHFSSVTQKSAQTHAWGATPTHYLCDTWMWLAAVTWLFWNAVTVTREFPTWLHTLFKGSRCCPSPCRVWVCVCSPTASMSTRSSPFLPDCWTLWRHMLVSVQQGIWDRLSLPDLNLSNILMTTFATTRQISRKYFDLVCLCA